MCQSWAYDPKEYLHEAKLVESLNERAAGKLATCLQVYRQRELAFIHKCTSFPDKSNATARTVTPLINDTQDSVLNAEKLHARQASIHAPHKSITAFKPFQR